MQVSGRQLAEAVALTRAWALRLEEAAGSMQAWELLSAAAVASMQVSVPRLVVAVVSVLALGLVVAQALERVQAPVRVLVLVLALGRVLAAYPARA
jgi:hypothetical protein